MTFIELVQRACSESGSIPGEGRPASVVGARGHELKFVGWVRSAYADIQMAEESWLWLRREAEGQLISGQSRFTPEALGAIRFRSWVPFSDAGQPLLTCYDPAVGRLDEAGLCFEPWAFAQMYDRGDPEPGRPQVASVDDQGRLFIYPRADKPYTLRYSYARAPQVLVADLDVPELPEMHHELIVYRALLKALNFDEAPNQYAYWKAEEQRMMAQLRTTQVPRLMLGGPLA